MKILIYGAGVVGSTYGWLLHKKGHDVTILAHSEKRNALRENGIHIVCQDFRNGERKVSDIIFNPHIIDELSADNDFDYIIVATNKLQLPSVLPSLKAGAGKANIVFFQNNWDSFDEIASYLRPEQYFFGFPFMVGGGRNGLEIRSYISGLKYSCTPLGEANGSVTERIRKFADILEEANLKPSISSQIIVWLISHYATAAGLSAGIMCAGGAAQFIKETDILKQTICAIREGFSICKKRGINPKDEKANRLYRLPLFLAVPIAKKIYADEALQKMFDGHVIHSPDEIRQMLDDMIEGGKTYGINTPCLAKMREEINRMHGHFKKK
ncbi:ketopantoate reductase family protein [Bacteroides heparinolyticus]|uniref:ketopantoate reductase family protein n=1 Tax=Prevotella heparinolytica TaxID=28113 RepID=UPI0035A031F2